MRKDGNGRVVRDMDGMIWEGRNRRDVKGWMG